MYAPLFIALGEFGVKELLLLTIIGLPLYSIPTIVAFSRQSKNKLPIALVNFLLGWTGLGTQSLARTQSLKTLVIIIDRQSKTK
ncbi:MAG TPA: superinfection immunity protein [Flavobacterium sp.]|nr:superinfection immunity protein [Flavobacterium sp.]